jgi:hypothetical protein
MGPPARRLPRESQELLDPQEVRFFGALRKVNHAQLVAIQFQILYNGC